MPDAPAIQPTGGANLAPTAPATLTSNRVAVAATMVLDFSSVKVGDQIAIGGSPYEYVGYDEGLEEGQFEGASDGPAAGFVNAVNGTDGVTEMNGSVSAALGPGDTVILTARVLGPSGNAIPVVVSNPTSPPAGVSAVTAGGYLTGGADAVTVSGAPARLTPTYVIPTATAPQTMVANGGVTLSPTTGAAGAVGGVNLSPSAPWAPTGAAPGNRAPTAPAPLVGAGGISDMYAAADPVT